MKVPAILLVAIGLLTACEREPVAPGLTSEPGMSQLSQVSLGADVARDVATLRRVTASFHDFEAASAAGWSAPITGCMSDPAAGAMGFHYGNGGLIDSIAQVDRPELLLYEPTRNGNLRLVGVEYIIPYEFHPRDADPPVLFGQPFDQVDGFGLWGLHVWAWTENPGGMFDAWNPRVSCQFATSVSTARHH